MLRVTLHLPELPQTPLGSAMGGAAIVELVDTLAKANAAWFAMNQDLPRCAAAHGVEYWGGEKNTHQTYRSAVEMANQPHQKYTCAEIVAYDVGRMRSLGLDA